MDAQTEIKPVVDQAVEKAVRAGMNTQLRDPILEGVGGEQRLPVREARRVPAAVVLMGVTFVVAYFLGRRARQQ